MALPRGGVPVGYEVSRALDCPLDVLVVRKVGVPSQPELALGAVGEGGAIVVNEEVASALGVEPGQVEALSASEVAEVERRVASFRAAAPPVDADGATAIVVDDGLATGSTARAAVAVLAERGVAASWVAVPIAPSESVSLVGREAQRVVCLRVPPRFGAVGSWYRDFAQVSEEDAVELVRRSRLR